MSDRTRREGDDAAPLPGSSPEPAASRPPLGAPSPAPGLPDAAPLPRAGAHLDTAHVPIVPARAHGIRRPARPSDLRPADRLTGLEAPDRIEPVAPTRAAEPDVADGLEAAAAVTAPLAGPRAAPGLRASSPPRVAAGPGPAPDRYPARPLLPDIAAWPGSVAARRGLAAVLRPGELRDAVAPTLLIRIGLFVFAAIGLTMFGDAGARAQDLGAMWNHWDGPHFLEVAARGYDPTGDPARAVLFPLYPALIYVGSFVLAPLVVAMAITLVSTLVAAVGLYRLVRPDGRALARGSVLAMSLFPVAYFLIGPYSEAPFLAFTVWAFVAARDDRWAVAGTLGLLAALTRLQGAFLLPALAVEYAVRRRRTGMPIVGASAIWLGLVAIGPLIYLAMNAYAYGDPLFFLSMQKQIFNVQTIAPWDVLTTLWTNVTSHPGGETWTTVYLAPLVSFAILGLVAVWATVSRRSTPGYATYTWLTLATLATLSWPISVPRYLIDVFPIYIAGAAIGRRREVGSALMAVSVLLLGAFTVLYVEGHWAF